MTTPSSPAVLVAIEPSPANMDRLRQVYTVHQALTHAALLAAAAAHGERIRAVLTNGTTGLNADIIAALPHLSIICAQGVGYEGIDLAAARARGIVVTHGVGTNAESVADHTLALMLAALRDIIGFDTLARKGGWRRDSSMRPIASGKRMGILGMGDIGRRIAKRGEAFNMKIGYHNRRAVEGVGYAYFGSPLALAAWSDVLIIVLPGGTATHHMVGTEELNALGPEGFLVNVGRGSVVDHDALVAALVEGRLAGAGLDVFDGEPGVPDALRPLPNVVLTPHVAGRSPEAAAAIIDLVIKNLQAHFAGQPVLTPVPEPKQT